MTDHVFILIILSILTGLTFVCGVFFWLDQQPDERYMSWGQKLVRQFIASIKANLYCMFHPFSCQVRVESEYTKHGFEHEEVITFVGVVNDSGIVKTYYGKSRDEH